MSILYNKITTVIELGNLVHNYTLLNERCGAAVPVIKADAYGHGLLEVAGALAKAGASTFAVGSVEEGAALRAGGIQGRIVCLLGPLDPEDYDALWASSLIGFIHCFEQLDALAEKQKGRSGLLSIALKFDTGMRRLGFTLRDVPEIARRLAAMPGIRLEMVSTHLATADEPQAENYVLEQAEEFAAIRASLRQHGLEHSANMANSAAMLTKPALYLDNQRAGIALYGCNPLHGTPLQHVGEGLKPAMSVKSRILSVHPLKAGQSISYGRTFTAQKDMTVAIVAAGYADAYSRGLSAKAWMCLKGRRVPVLGRVCMQMCAVDVSEVAGVAHGDDIYLLGGEGEGRITPEDLAGWWGTITYEVFCLLGLNKRVFVS